MIAFFTGFLTSLSLIVAIGAQNAYVLQSGLRREYVGMVVVFCALSDALLILAGVYFIGEELMQSLNLSKLLTLAGIGFLIFYGGTRIYQAILGRHDFSLSEQPKFSRKKSLAFLFAITYLNPHVYIDTVMIIGNISQEFQGLAKHEFAIGAISGSAAFFSLLGYGAQWLAPYFQSPRFWRIFDMLMGGFMFYLAFLLFEGL